MVDNLNLCSNNEWVSLTHSGKHGTSLSDNRILTDRNGSLGRQAERVAQSATDRRNLIWVMPAQGANIRFIDLGRWHNTSASLFVCAPRMLVLTSRLR